MTFRLKLVGSSPRCEVVPSGAANHSRWGCCNSAIAWHTRSVVFSLLFLFLVMLKPSAALAGPPGADSPAFTTVPELRALFDLLYQQKFYQARQGFEHWESRNPKEPFGQVAIAASYLFEELYRQKVLTSDFFLNEEKFLRGIDGAPDPERLRLFREHLSKARELARLRQKVDPDDAEALFALSLTSGMESDALAILEKKRLAALKRMKEADKYSKALLAHHPDATDAYIAPGIANYIVGSLDSGTRLGLWFAGIHGDKKTGMRQMAKTATTGRYLQPFAKIVLALAARREHQSMLAQKLFRELKNQYPDNALYALEYSKATRQISMN